MIKPINEMSIDDILESIHAEYHHECLETGNITTDFEGLIEFIEEEVFENWGLKLYQKKAIVENFEMDVNVLHIFYLIKGGLYESK